MRRNPPPAAPEAGRILAQIVEQLAATARAVAAGIERETTAELPAVSWNGTQYGWLCVWNQTTGTAGVCAVQDASFSPAAHTTLATAMTIDLPNNTPQNNVFAADIYVGGQLSVPAGSLKPGTYSAPLTVTITVIG